MTIEFVERDDKLSVIGCHDECVGTIEVDDVIGVVFSPSTYYPYWVELDEIAQIFSKMKELGPKPPIEAYKSIPQTLPVDEDTVIRITDGPHVGLWKSTREGWMQVSDNLEVKQF